MCGPKLVGETAPPGRLHGAAGPHHARVKDGAAALAPSRGRRARSWKAARPRPTPVTARPWLDGDARREGVAMSIQRNLEEHIIIVN